MKLFSYIAFLIFLQSSALLITVLWLDHRSTLNRLIAIANVFVAIWTGCLTFVFGLPDLNLAFRFYQASYLGILFVMPMTTNVYLFLAGFSRRTRTLVLLFSAGFAVFLYGMYFKDGFYYSAFVDGPWGNVGVDSSQQFWSSVAPFVFIAIEGIAGLLILRVRKRATSNRLHRQLTGVLFSIFGSYFIYFACWTADVLWKVPPTEMLAGAFVAGTNFYLILRFRYLRKDTDLLKKHVGQALQEGHLLVDAHRTVLTANPAAERFSPAAPLLGRDLIELFDFRSAVEAEWNLASQGRVGHRWIPSRIGGHGVLVSLLPHFDPAGDFAGAVVLLGELGSFEVNGERLGLTPREKELALLMLQGQSYQAMADELGIASGTVKRHLHNLFDKTQVSNRMELLGKLLQKLPADC